MKVMIEMNVQTQLQELLRRIPDIQLEQEQLVMHKDKQTWKIVLIHSPYMSPRKAQIESLEVLKNKDKTLVHIVVSPWISPESAAIFAQQNINYLDGQGNARIAFGNTFIERLGYPAPKAEKRYLKSIYSPISARVLRVLLRNPTQSWTLTALAKATQVSIGQVYNVKDFLLEQNWLNYPTNHRGAALQLSQPHKLLETWSKQYSPTGKKQGFYSFENHDDLEQILQAIASKELVLAGLHAAQHIMPYSQFTTTQLYATKAGFKQLQTAMTLKSVSRGENIVIYFEPDEGIFLDAQQNKVGIWQTSPIQTYLDLNYLGERAAEAAEFIFQHTILPIWEKS
jgi:hypothetical protein